MPPLSHRSYQNDYQNIVVGHLDSALESVHFENYPEADESLIDEELERDMDLLLELVSLGRAARNTAQLKIRQPLAKAMVVGGAENYRPSSWNW